MILAWLQPILDARGVTNPDGVSRRARVTHCRKCGGHIIRGLDSDPCGMAVTTDVTPIDETGELLAILTGRGTFQLSWRGDRYEVDPRSGGQISHTPPSTITAVAEHRCGAVLPIAKVTRPPRRIVTLPDSEEPPF